MKQFSGIQDTTHNDVSYVSNVLVSGHETVTSKNGSGM